MTGWITQNAGTIVITLMLALAVFLIIRGMVRDRRAGKGSCGNACSHCPMSAACRKKDLQQRRMNHVENRP